MLLLAGLSACSSSTDDPSQPAGPTIQLTFSPGSVSFGEDRSADVELRNLGNGAAGPVELAALAVLPTTFSRLPRACHWSAVLPS